MVLVGDGNLVLCERERGFFFLRYTVEFIQNLIIICSAVPLSIDHFELVMTRVPIPSSRFSSESISPLDLAPGLTSRFQATSFQPSTSDCAVLPDSTALGAGVPPSLLSVAEEGLALSVERVSSEVLLAFGS